MRPLIPSRAPARPEERRRAIRCRPVPCDLAGPTAPRRTPAMARALHPAEPPRGPNRSHCPTPRADTWAVASRIWRGRWLCLAPADRRRGGGSHERPRARTRAAGTSGNLLCRRCTSADRDLSRTAPPPTECRQAHQPRPGSSRHPAHDGRGGPRRADKAASSGSDRSRPAPAGTARVVTAAEDMAPDHGRTPHIMGGPVHPDPPLPFGRCPHAGRAGGRRERWEGPVRVFVLLSSSPAAACAERPCRRALSPRRR